MTTIKFRPHAGEVLINYLLKFSYSVVFIKHFFLWLFNPFSLVHMKAGDVDHLAATFLIANNISHGINLRKSPVLQHLYYLAQVIIITSAVSPC